MVKEEVRMSLPKVSCFCATYGRPPVLVEEVIESFLRQDYEGEKELVILNDWPMQHLICDAPDVQIVNVQQRLTPIGKKFNETVALCSGEILFPWEDDDIYMPWRLSYSVERLQNGMFHTGNAFWMPRPNYVEYCDNLHHCNLAVSRKLFDAVGGYSEADIMEVDQVLFERLTNVVDEFIVSAFNRGSLPAGRIVLRPHWEQDYVALLRNAAQRT
jgi:glycosyltransferase involved in cell wall biosynthesis